MHPMGLTRWSITSESFGRKTKRGDTCGSCSSAPRYSPSSVLVPLPVRDTAKANCRLATAGSSSSVFGDYPITQGSLTAGGDYAVIFQDGTLTILSPDQEILRALQEGDVQPGGVRRLGYNGVLLSMARSAFGGLAPAAGGNGPTTLTPADLANLSPAAGGNGPNAAQSGGTMPLIECNDDMPCMLNQ